MASLKLHHRPTPKLTLCFVHFFFQVPTLHCCWVLTWGRAFCEHLVTRFRSASRHRMGHCQITMSSMGKMAKPHLGRDSPVGLGWVR